MKTITIILLIVFSQPALAQEKSLDEINTIMTAGWYEEANLLLDSHLGTNSPDPKALFMKAQAAIYLGHLEEAQEWSEKSVESAPQEAEYWSQLGTIKAFRIRRNPMKGLTLGRSSKKNYEKAVELDPLNLVALQSLMKFHLHAPGIVGGNKDKARQLAEQILALDKVQGHLARAEIFRRVDQDLPQARVEMDAAVSVNPQDPLLCYELAGILMGEGQTDDAWRYHHLGKERDPDQTRGQSQLAAAYFLQDRNEEALVIYLALTETDPDNTKALIGLGSVYLAQDNPAEAATIFQKLLESRPDFPPAKYFLARSYLEMKTNPEESVRLLHEYLDVHLNLQWPSRPLAHWKLALALEKLQKYDEAWESISLAQKLSGGNNRLSRDAKRLEFMAKDD